MVAYPRLADLVAGTAEAPRWPEKGTADDYARYWDRALYCPNGHVKLECGCQPDDPQHRFWLHVERGYGRFVGVDILDDTISTVDSFPSSRLDDPTTVLDRALAQAKDLRDMQHPNPVEAEYGGYDDHDGEDWDDQDPIGDVDNLSDREPGWRL